METTIEKDIISPILAYSIKNKVSDIHLTEDKVPMVRLNGDLVKLTNIPIKKSDIEGIIKKYNPDLFYLLDKQKHIDCSFGFQNTRFRANFYFERKKLAVALRLISSSIPEMSSLNLPKPINGILGLRNGLVLVTGATGSGKSTTIASIVNEINKMKSEHILTLEDPIEYIYNDAKSIIHQREIGSDCLSFSDGIACALREDPDIIVLGEMRNHESISSALTLAETGHLVFATLHTKSAAESIDRIIDVFPPDQQSQVRIQLANTLKYVVAQTLVKTIDGKGRLPLIELMVVNSAISAAIISKAPMGTIKDQISQNHLKLGSQTFSQCAKDFVERRLVSLETVKDYIEPDASTR